MPPRAVIAACCLILACSKFESAFSLAMPARTTKQRIVTTQLSAWSIPVPQTNNNPFFPSPSLHEPSSATWYEDCGSAAIHRNVVYKDDDEQDDYYLWDAYDVGRNDEDRRGYGFARIEAYETYLAYADDHDVAKTTRQSLPLSPKRPSLLRRGLGKLWLRLRR